MFGEVRRYLRDHAWAVRVPRPLQERVLEATKAIERLSASIGRSPTPEEVAAEMGCDLEAALEALQAGSAYSSVSLDAPAGSVEDGERTLADTIGYEDERISLAEDVAALRDLRGVLDDRDRHVLYLRFVEDLTRPRSPSASASRRCRSPGSSVERSSGSTNGPRASRRSLRRNGRAGRAHRPQRGRLPGRQRGDRDGAHPGGAAVRRLRVRVRTARLQPAPGAVPRGLRGGARPSAALLHARGPRHPRRRGRDRTPRRLDRGREAPGGGDHRRGERPALRLNQPASWKPIVTTMPPPGRSI